MKRKTPSGKKETCVSLSRQLRTEIKTLAVKEQRSASSVIEDASKLYLSEKRAQAKEAREQRREQRIQKAVEK